MDRVEACEGQQIVARKLKTFITNIGFFELALAAPSMKAALEAWGMGHNAFHQGLARQTDDPAIVAATMAMPGTVLRRPVGTKGAFTQNAQLPKDWAPAPPKAKASKTPPPKAVPRAKAPRHPKSDSAAILSFQKATERRDRARAQQGEKDAARAEQARARDARLAAKAKAALARGEARHSTICAATDRDR